jgi:uncharacterized protein YndB with AHSA1/START domain
MEQDPSPTDPLFTKTITINAPASKVWQALTVPALMQQWMSETKIDIITNWIVGGPITIKGDWYKTGFENKGYVLQFEPERLLRYSHLSSLSRLPDSLENYSIVEFRLHPQDEKTILTITLTNFPTDTIYKHLAFYWNVGVELLKKFVEEQGKIW